MRQNRRLLIGLLAFVALCAGLVSALYFEQQARETDVRLAVPDFRPQFQLPDLNGKTREISEWDGSVIVLNFWATWCPPCLEEIPEFVKLQSEWASKGVQFVGVAIDEVAAVTEYVQQQPINYPLLMGGMEGVALSQRYGNRVGALPYTVVIDRQGRVVFHRAGAVAMDQMRLIVGPLLHDK